MEWSVYDPTFTDRMEWGKDAARRDIERLAYLGARVTYKRPKPRYVSVELAAKMLGGISVEMVRRICRRGGIPGARRLKVGRGGSWSIPLTGGRVVVLRGKSGPPGRYQEPLPI